jgi:hypothetical protein
MNWGEKRMVCRRAFGGSAESLAHHSGGGDGESEAAADGGNCGGDYRLFLVFHSEDTGPAWIEVHWPQPNIYDLAGALESSFGTTDIKGAAEELVAQRLLKKH